MCGTSFLCASRFGMARLVKRVSFSLTMQARLEIRERHMPFARTRCWYR